MTVISGSQLGHRLYEEAIIQPYRKEQLNPASYDVCIGDTAIFETEQGWVNYDLTQHSKTNPAYLMPGEFCLIATREVFVMPSDIAAEFRLKSSRAREGWNAGLAMWIDPGWKGSVLTMELMNATRYHRLAIYPDLRIGQIIFFSTSRLATYNGKYNNDTTVKGSKDRTLNAPINSQRTATLT